MADLMDLDELDGPSRVPSRTSRYAPKNHKLKPKPEPQELDSNPLKKKKEEEELDSENQAAKLQAADDAAVKMDCIVEVKPETKDETMADADDGDRVVREIDVFFTPQIDPNTQLYVLQYPLRPCWRPYELDERCEEVRVKPPSAEVEVDLSIDVDSKNYDTDADPRVRMTKQTLSSSMKPTRATGYAVGVLIGNKLHINPIRAVVQLRPSMEHLKSDGSKKKTSITSNVESAIKLEDLKDGKSAGPSRKQNNQTGISNEHNDAPEESWIALKYHSSKSDYSIRYLRKMAADESSPIQFSMSPYNYVSSLCPGAFNDNIKSQGPPRRFLLSLPLEERFKTWFREGPPVNRFNTLKEHLARDDSIDDVLRVLQKHAHLVQGLWVPKTSLLPKGGDGAEGLARDYFLLLFSKNPVISYEQVKVGPLKGVVQAVMNILATERPELQGWKFLKSPDEEFITLYPHIVEEQKQAWEHAEKLLTESLFGGRRGVLGSKNTSKPDISSRPGASKSQKGAARSSNGTVARTSMSNETREALPKALQKVFQTHKVCSYRHICQRLREMALSESNRGKGGAREAIAAADGANAPQEELLEIVSQVAVNIHGVYVSKSSLDHPQYDDLRKIVIDLLIAEGSNAKLKKASIIEAAKMQLKRDITPNEYQKVLNELCVSQGSAWVLKRGDGIPL